jgi:hypothetical protein
LQKEDEKAFQDLAKKLKLKIAKKMIEDEEEKRRIEEEILAKEQLKIDENEAKAEAKKNKS